MTRHSFWDFQVEIDECATKEWYAQADRHLGTAAQKRSERI